MDGLQKSIAELKLKENSNDYKRIENGEDFYIGQVRENSIKHGYGVKKDSDKYY